VSAVSTWGKDVGIRAVKTFSQTLVALFGAGQFDILHTPGWKADLGVAVGAGLVSILQNVATIPTGPKVAAAVVPDPAIVTRQEIQAADVAMRQAISDRSRTASPEPVAPPVPPA
jgi:hypothetical protein